MQILYNSLLALHICAFITAVGTLVSSLVSYHQFWRLYSINKEHGKAAFNFFLKTRRIEMIGLFVAILAGLSMATIVSFVYANFLWFRIKMFLVVLIFVNGFTLGRVSTTKLRNFIADSHDEKNKMDIGKLKRNSNIFVYTQLFIYMLIIIMAAFRFS